MIKVVSPDADEAILSEINFMLLGKGRGYKSLLLKSYGEGPE